MAINELRSITTFIKAAELGSLRKAAQDLGISPQAASKALAQLESHLDARLFHRTTRVMSLTDAGQRLLEEVQPSVLGMQRALLNARTAKDEFAGPLRIAGPRTTFQPILWRLVEEFCEMHPGIQPDVLLEDRVGNWVEDRVDVGFRLGASPDEGVIAWCAGNAGGAGSASLQCFPASRHRKGRTVACKARRTDSRPAGRAGDLQQ
jgi:DNA-binding transcriptional LysR family regulator